MAFPQGSVSLSQAYGIPGEFAYDGPSRAASWEIQGNGHANIVGATVYTVTTPLTDTSSGVATAGGTGPFAGILANPKVYANYNGNLSATMTIPDNIQGELVTMGILNVTSVTANNPGDVGVYDTTTGAISTLAPSFSDTASFATNVMTVTVAGGVHGIGQLVTAPGVSPGTVIISLGTGTGGTGTYNLSTSPGTIASGPVTIGNGDFAGTGKAFIPHSKVILRSGGANATTIFELTD